MTELREQGPQTEAVSNGHVLHVPGADVVGIIYFVKKDNPPCFDCSAPSLVVAMSNDGVYLTEQPVCAIDAAYRAADGQTIRRFEDEDIITRERFS